ncbi:hypothetical protein TanjilG_00173 [Lupinus angustifolius]|uniref:Uncharacterized protein n=1 Tax=Lupinus angustifolius TaxID=3871 RepID=A0A1J7H478_LUPAN|nr:hypothetical protein TanjilG_00173 [Lupinus angustifolius]
MPTLGQIAYVTVRFDAPTSLVFRHQARTFDAPTSVKVGAPRFRIFRPGSMSFGHDPLVTSYMPPSRFLGFVPSASVMIPRSCPMLLDHDLTVTSHALRSRFDG